MLCGGGLSQAMFLSGEGGHRGSCSQGQEHLMAGPGKGQPGCVAMAELDKASRGRSGLVTFSGGQGLCVLDRNTARP